MQKLIFRIRRLLIMLLLIFVGSCWSWAQVRITGTVEDSNGEPMIGASVLVKGTNTGGITDVDGCFSVDVPDSNAILIISYIGCKTVEVRANNGMKVILEEDSDVLDEVVVIGYGSVRRKDVTTAISSISQKDLENRPIVSAAQAIQGKAAGVSVISPNGAPGGEMSIRVRGTTSFNGSNDPLYVVDGVPVDNINFLTPNDIADIQILKDASSAAIYGSRAANGVVLISTKSANTEKPTISLSAQYGLSQVRKTMDVLNAAQYKELQDEIGLVNLPDNLTDKTDWFDEIYRTGSTQNYQISLSQNTGRTKYLINVGYFDEDGIIKPSFYKRYNFRVNVDTKVTDWMKVTANVIYSDYNSNGINTGNGANRGGVVLAVINTPTYAPIWDPDKTDQYYNNFYGVNITSPAENIGRNKYTRNRENRLIASGNVHFDIMPGLTFNTKFSLDRRNAHDTDFTDPVSTTYGRENYGLGYDGRNSNQLLIWDNVLNYVKDFGKNGIDVMLGSSWTDSDYRNSYISGIACVMHALISYGSCDGKNKKVAILSSGNVAQGSFVQLSRLGYEPKMFYRKTMKEFYDTISDYDIIVNGIEIIDGNYHIIDKTMIKKVKKGALIIDAAADAGGAIETSKFTRIDEPLYVKDGVYYYCVNNAPSILYRDVSKVISETFTKYIYNLDFDKIIKKYIGDKNK